VDSVLDGISDFVTLGTSEGEWLTDIVGLVDSVLEGIFDLAILGIPDGE